MFAITLNPGFVCILAAMIALALPRGLRPAAICGAALLALWVMLDRELGAAAAGAQMGLPVVPLNLDTLNRIFGIAMLIALVIIGVCSGARRNRSEDAAFLLLAGGAISALFVGDLVSFVAAASLAGLAAAWLVFASPLPNSANSGVRLLMWHGLEGLLFLIGVSFQLSAGAASSILTQLDIETIGGAFLFAALLFRVGAPLAHVWLKDAIGHASPVGAAALGVFSSMLGVYALARLFPSEPLLVPIGAAMAVIGLIYALAEDDMRRASASGLTAQIGTCVMLIGIGSPLALAAAEGHAFTLTLSFLALHIALGAILGRVGSARISKFEGVARAMPFSTALLVVAGLAAAGLPPFAGYVTTAIALEAHEQWGAQLPWLLTSAVAAGLFIALMVRPVLHVFRAMPGKAQRNEAPFPILLGGSVAVFFCVSVGLAPSWLYGLLPAELVFRPYETDRWAPQLELMALAGAAYVGLYAFKLAPREASVRVLDIDALYRGPGAGAGRWVGVVLLRLYGAWRGLWAQWSERAGKAAARVARSFDQPYRHASGALQFAAVAALLALALWFGG